MIATEVLIGLWRGEERIAVLDPLDRGFAYGDGLFETMRAHAGVLPWWPQHRSRLLRGATRLGIALPTDALLEAALGKALGHFPFGIIKFVLTRGVSARGYAPEIDAQPTLMVLAWSPPPLTNAPLAVDVLDLRLGVQPALAGIKHLNRLEQVLGAREVIGRGLDEGLMADLDGRLICGTRANLFVCVDGRWITPSVDRAGVAGITRDLLLQVWPVLSEGEIRIDDLPDIDAIFLANAVRGILPIDRCGARVLEPFPADLIDARAALAASHPAFRES
mgnify:CR=1 FL=1